MPTLRGKKITDAFLAESPSLPKWKRLALCYTGVTDAGIQQLKNAKRLVELEILSTGLTGRALQTISSVSTIATLVLRDAGWIDDRAVTYLEAMPQLHELYLDGARLSDKAMDSIAKLKELWSLDLSNTDITDAGVAVLGSLPKLRLLFLNRTAVTGVGFDTFSDGRHSSLGLEECPLTDEGIVILTQHVPSIRNLYLSRTRLSDGAMKALASLRCLSDLRINGAQVSDRGVAYFIGHPSLEKIELKGTGVSDSVIARLKRSAPRVGCLLVDRSRVGSAVRTNGTVACYAVTAYRRCLPSS